ncbi:5-methyltetrahydrofolate--homocysteine methyltransferase [Tepiditoga spiralis]|uniref:Methionine synthase n=1 Tax=Tepiditoga spiralis TaxID=2108365 RepID=A0A7G1G5G5_9BACT|nr:homocysteine S-methyltransferase family protein [Tepiditoga spiralis]BBE30274.1 5-methyltetrahydrofolate--homocysteine methyltransferase [Tepiditoga spiralis]
MHIKERIKNELLFFDGAMGTQLQKKGLKLGTLPETLNITNPNIIKEIHELYIRSGAQIITTNTFGASEFKLKRTEYTVEEIVESAVKIAKSATGVQYVALDIGPIGRLLEPSGTLKFEEAYNMFKRQMIAGEKAGADLILIETISDLYEAKAAILAAKENTKLPVFCTMTFTEDGRTFTGTDPLTMVNVLEGLDVDALGLNCSVGPKEAIPIVEKIIKYSSIPVMVQPNAGLPEIENGETKYKITPKEFLTHMKKIVEMGAQIIGGCCGTDERFIKLMTKELKTVKPKKIKEKEFTAVSSYSKTVKIGETLKIIGERINPTGKKKFKQALRDKNLDYIIKEAINQKEEGADILDVNVGLPEINEEEIMIKVIKEIQSVMGLPLQIDSSDPKVIEHAVRIYNGKPLINSVNGKKESMEKIFPIVKKYGACVVGLTLDERGIPKKAEERVEVAEKIIKTAQKYGIHKKNILIDCLVLTASAQQEDVMETIKAVRMVKEKFNVKTTLGISNVSFGLPNRSILNKTFLAMALTAGVDAPILNPKKEEIKEIIYSYKVLSNQDKQSEKFIEKYSKVIQKKLNKEIKMQKEIDLKQIIIDGLKDEAIEATKILLKEKKSMEIINEFLIPALDIVGQRYEKEEIFLPQLIRSAETVKKSFELIKEIILKSGEEKKVGKKILLATVQGDVHDIGKNIVKVILENYGYEIVDLGKDVPAQKIIESIKKENIRLVGLSALMTTTVKSMEYIIKEIRKNKLDCKIMVGGAVLNQKYTDMIKADYYVKDAQKAVEIAKQFFSI